MNVEATTQVSPFKKIIRKFVSKKYRDFIYDHVIENMLFIKHHFKIVVKAKFIYLFQFFLPQTPENKVFAYMGRYGVGLIPHDFVRKYKKLKITQYKDESNHLTYVIHNNKRLYFSQHLRAFQINKMYKELLSEQDECSPHRYIKKSWDELSGKTLLDIGAAEGIIALNVIDIADYIYLFEYEENWIEALNATFAPYKDKVKIIKKYVSNVDDDYNLTLDHFTEGKSIDNLFVKMDIEGSELAALQGATKILNNAKNLHLAVCTYHTTNEFKDITELLSEKHINYDYTKAKMFYEDEFRDGVVRGYRQ